MGVGYRRGRIWSVVGVSCTKQYRIVCAVESRYTSQCTFLMCSNRLVGSHSLHYTSTCKLSFRTTDCRILSLFLLLLDSFFGTGFASYRGKHYDFSRPCMSSTREVLVLHALPVVQSPIQGREFKTSMVTSKRRRLSRKRLSNRIHFGLCMNRWNVESKLKIWRVHGEIT